MAKAHIQFFSNQGGCLRVWDNDAAIYRKDPISLGITIEVIDPQIIELHGLKGEMSHEIKTAIIDECKRVGVKEIWYDRIKGGVERKVKLKIR